MKKQVNPARNKALKSAGQNEEIIDLKNMVAEDHTIPESSGEDVLDLTDEVLSEKAKDSDSGILELTEKMQPASAAANKKDASDNVIHLSEMTSSLSLEETDEIEDIPEDVIMDFDDDILGDDSDEDLDKLTKQLESAMSDSYNQNNYEIDPIEKLPDANIIDVEEYRGDNSDSDLDSFDLLPEAEPGMADNLDAIDLGDLEDDTTFSDIGDDLAEQLSELSEANIENDTDLNDIDDSREETASEAVFELNRAMMADKANTRKDEDNDTDLNQEIQNIRNKLDSVFPEEDEDGQFSLFSESAKKGKEEDEDFNPEELVLPTFEDESIEEEKSSKASSFEIDATSLDLDSSPFGEDINLYTDDEAPSKPKVNPLKVSPLEDDVTISSKQIEETVKRLIETKYSKIIEQTIVKAIEKAVTREIQKIKKAILDESGSL